MCTRSHIFKHGIIHYLYRITFKIISFSKTYFTIKILTNLKALNVFNLIR